jgi:hypothetical protein
MGAIDLSRILIAAATLWGTPATVGDTAPAAEAPLPRDAAAYVAAMTDVRPRQRAAARAWDGHGDVPEDLALFALYEQRMALALSDDRALRQAVLPDLPARERRGVRDEVRAQVCLNRLAEGWPIKPRSEYKSGPAEDAADLWRYYGRGKRRFGVSRSLLAAVNLVETGFNRIRSDSVADAQGPMQFIRPTWAAYGLGGDVRDPRDAILGAANYLHANGAPQDNSGALYHYNPSLLYVRAVLRYARNLRSPAAFRALYARSLFVRAKGGGHTRLTGP